MAIPLPPFRLAHMSDPHLAPPPFNGRLTELASKTLLSRLAWRRKRNAHTPQVLAAIVADLKAQAPDHIAITGDLTNFSTPEEFALAKAWLAGFAAPGDLTVSPGNHDALVAAGPDPFAAWDDWMGDRAGSFPRVRIRGPAAIVNLCSARPTLPLLAQGALGAEQIARLGPVLDELKRQGLYRVVMLHHPITPGVVTGRKSLVDAAALRRALQTHGAELVLHGHAHDAVVGSTPGPVDAIPVLGVPSASAAGHGRQPAARWHGVEISPRGAGFTTRIVVRGLMPDGQIGELGRYVLA
jgi:3',5'-cyclic AMP phosphodiesterase CpdA